MMKPSVSALGLAAVMPLLSAAQGVMTTVAGSPWVFPASANGARAVDAPLLALSGVAVDSAGNVFAADNGNNLVVKISLSGILTIVAGTGNAGFSGDGAAAATADLSLPAGLTVDGGGNLYIADSANNRIRRVTPDGRIGTVAGNGSHNLAGSIGDGGAAMNALLNSPSSVAVDRSGNLYIAEVSRIRKVDPTGIISTVASFSGSLAVDHAGSLYVGDTVARRVHKLDAAGTVTTVAGNGQAASAGDGGLATNAALNPRAIALDSAGNLYIADDNRIRKVGLDGIIHTLAGTGLSGFSGDGGAAAAAQFLTPQALAADASGNLYVADTFNFRIRRIDSNGNIVTVAGSGSAYFYGDGGPATRAQLRWPDGVAVSADGNIFISDSANDRIRKVSPDGTISTIAGTASRGFSGDGGRATDAHLNYPRGLALDSAGALYFADVYNHRVRKITPDGLIRTIAGTGEPGFSGDGGQALEAQLYYPQGVALDPRTGNLYIADSSNYRIRIVAPDGTIRTVAGTGEEGFSGDGGPAISARLAAPSAVAVDRSGNVYFVDSTVCYPVACGSDRSKTDVSNQRVRKVDTNGIIATVAGNGLMDFAGDGGPAISASLCFPEGIALDSSGNLYIVDAGNNAIRKVDSAGIISTLALVTVDTEPSYLNLNVDDYLKAGGAAALDPAGNLYIADLLNQRVRKITFSPYLSGQPAVNSASFRPGSVAPGSIVSIFGFNLASDIQRFASAPLPTVLTDASVAINNVAAPLLFVSPTQINAQVPFETPSGVVPLEVKRTGMSSGKGSLSVTAAAPGIFTMGSGDQGAIVTSGGELAALKGSLAGIAARPARPGEFISIFLTGLGDVRNRPASGAPPPPTSLSETLLNPTATIGTATVTPTFSGLAPFLVGIYQVNVQVPEATPSGTVQVSISIGGAVSNTVTMAVQ